jgi:PAS domain S-box-containing protein
MLTEEKIKSLSKEEVLREYKKLQKAYHELEKRKQEGDNNELFDNSSELIYILDFEGKFIDVNKAVCEKYGYKKEELIGKYGDILVAPNRNNVKEAEENFLNVVTKNAQVKYDWWSITKSGEVFPKEFVMRRAKYKGKDVVMMIGRDITERTDYQDKLIESEKQYKDLFDRNLAGIYRTKLNGEIIDCNQSFASILGYESKRELIGKVMP